MRLTVLEHQLRARAFAMALDPASDVMAGARALAVLAAGNSRALERVLRQVRAAALPAGQLSERVVAAVAAALESVASDGNEEGGP